MIYIDVNALDDFKNSKRRRRGGSLRPPKMLKQARDADWVDYASVTALKMAALRLAWKGFAKRNSRWQPSASL
ncbi:hypothetical protein ACVXG7_24540 [Enterobacter hormaechei]